MPTFIWNTFFLLYIFNQKLSYHRSYVTVERKVVDRTHYCVAQLKKSISLLYTDKCPGNDAILAKVYNNLEQTFLRRESQCCFLTNRDTVDMIFVTRLHKKTARNNRDIAISRDGLTNTNAALSIIRKMQHDQKTYPKNRPS